MDEKLRQLVWERADARCEYCQVPQEFDEMPFHVDHIIPLKQHGPTVESNLALSCFPCNVRKGPLTAIVLPETQEIVRLFHPRTDAWHEHFQWSAATLVGLTAVGLATIDMLAINQTDRVLFRKEISKRGAFPTSNKPR